MKIILFNVKDFERFEAGKWCDLFYIFKKNILAAVRNWILGQPKKERKEK